MSTLEDRIDRLESLDEIRQLAAKYALALDMRDMDALVNLFCEDIQVGKNAQGRQALRQYMDRTLRSPFTGTSHHIGGHIIEFDHPNSPPNPKPDRAQGIVYSKNEHETDNAWVIMQMLYVDEYQRQQGRWYFRRRLPLYWYASDMGAPPVGEKKMRWPGSNWSEGNFHKLFPSFAEFWQRCGDHDNPVVAPAPFDKFITTMRRGQAAPKVKVRAD